MQHTAVLLAVLSTLSPAPAAADRLASARGQPLTEVSHEATVRIEDGVARYRVRRTFANAGTRAEEAALRIDLAHGAAVTGLRIRASRPLVHRRPDGRPRRRSPSTSRADRHRRVARRRIRRCEWVRGRLRRTPAVFGAGAAPSTPSSTR